MSNIEIIANRYRSMIGKTKSECQPVPGTSVEHLAWMLEELKYFTDVEKQMRWLGFVQGVLIMKGFTTVPKERDFTRPYFTKAS